MMQCPYCGRRLVMVDLERGAGQVVIRPTSAMIASDGEFVHVCPEATEDPGELWVVERVEDVERP